MELQLLEVDGEMRVQAPALKSAGLHIEALWGRDIHKTKKIAENAGIPFGIIIYLCKI